MNECSQRKELVLPHDFKKSVALHTRARGTTKTEEGKMLPIIVLRYKAREKSVPLEEGDHPEYYPAQGW